MPGPSSGLLRAGIGLKLNQIKRATQSYLRDRTNQATGTVTSYAIAAGLFAAAGIFLIAALLVGAAALFRWVEIHYGQFWAFGAIGGLLAVIACICAGCGGHQAQTPCSAVPVAHQPLAGGDQGQSHQARPDRGGQGYGRGDPARPRGAGGHVHRRRRNRPGHDNRSVNIGLILMASLLGYAAVRRRQQARHAEI